MMKALSELPILSITFLIIVIHLLNPSGMAWAQCSGSCGGGGGADIGGGNSYELAYESFVIEGAISLDVVDGVFPESGEKGYNRDPIFEHYLNQLRSSLPKNKDNLLKLLSGKMLESLTKCPIKIVPSKIFCAEALNI